MRKPQSHSRLKTLPPAKQLQLWEFLQANKLADGIKFVKKKFGLVVYTSTLSYFYSWYQVQQDFQMLESNRTRFEELLSKKFPTEDPKTIQEYGQSLFTMQAAASGKPEKFQDMEYLRLAKEKEHRETSKLNLDLEKFEVETCDRFIKWSADEKAQKILRSNVSHREKIKQLRKHYFADVDALEKSGKVKIPK